MQLSQNFERVNFEGICVEHRAVWLPDSSLQLRILTISPACA